MVTGHVPTDVSETVLSYFASSGADTPSIYYKMSLEKPSNVKKKKKKNLHVFLTRFLLARLAKTGRSRKPGLADKPERD